MTTPPVVSVTDELITELESVAHTGEGAFMIECAQVYALLAERAELKRDAAIKAAALVEIYRQVDGNIRPTVRDIINGMHDAANDIYDYCDNISAAIDDAMQS